MQQFVSKIYFGKFERTYHNQAANANDARDAARESVAMRGWTWADTQRVE